MPAAQEESRRILDRLPDDASWDEVQYSICVRDRVERGRRADEGKLIPHEDVEVRMKQRLDE
jgi:uncharacterized protein (UPF0248 family)